MHFITFLIIMSLCSSSFCTLLKINNHPYESSSAFYDNLHCLECPYIFASSEDIVTYSNKSYHRRCWRLAHANFWGSKRYWEEEGHPKRGYENL